MCVSKSVTAIGFTPIQKKNTQTAVFEVNRPNFFRSLQYWDSVQLFCGFWWNHSCTQTYKHALSMFCLRDKFLLWVSSSLPNNNCELLQTPGGNQSALLGSEPKPVCPPVCVPAFKSLEGQQSWRVRHCRVRKPAAVSLWGCAQEEEVSRRGETVSKRKTKYLHKKIQAQTH